MLRLGGLLLLAVASLARPAHAQTVASSAGPERVSVTVYRDLNRPAARPIDPNWLNGFALISETRRISIPAGDTEIRFEGVAGGILPQSAIVTGLPEDVLEKNHDAYLLSPASLIDRSLGRRVHLRRTSRATGAVREQEAVVRSGADRALVLQTAEGFEALRCSGLPETIVYDGVPAGLPAKPTLSVRTRSSRALTATVTLSYLTSGLDWQANYVANLSPSGDRVDLFAWLTLANGDETSFVDASTQAVAGRLNREAQPFRPQRERSYAIQCWPQGTTSDIELRVGESEEIVVTGFRVNRFGAPPPPPPPPPPPAPVAAMEAAQEELGDVKLYRIPEPVTVASQSRKQVAFLQRTGVRARTLYRQSVNGAVDGWRTATRMLVTRNRTAEGLGVPLPAGQMVLFGTGRDRPILLGQGSLEDRAIGEDVEVEIGAATGVRTQVSTDPSAPEQYIVTVTNDQATPVQYEALLQFDRVRSSTTLARRNGRPVWRVTVPANGRATLRFRPNA